MYKSVKYKNDIFPQITLQLLVHDRYLSLILVIIKKILGPYFSALNSA